MSYKPDFSRHVNAGHEHAGTDLQESKRHLAALLNSLPGMAYRFLDDAHRRYVFASEGCRELTGYEPEALIGNGEISYEDLIHPEDRTFVRKKVETALAARQPFELSYRLTTPDGREKWVQEIGRGVAFQDGEGAIVEGIAIDITERRQAEERFRIVVEASPNGFVMVDRAGDIVLVNPQTEAMFGYSREELIGQSVEMLVPGRFRGRHAADRLAYHEKPDIRPMGVGRDLYGQHKDGTEFPVEVGLSPVTMWDDDLVLGAITDITTRKKYEHALTRAREEAEEISKLKSAFLVHINQELRTQLMVIRGFADLLADAETGENREFVRSIELGSQRLLDLVNSFANVSTLETILGITRTVLAAPATEADDLKLNLEEINLGREIEERIPSLRPLAENKGLQLDAAIDASDLWVIGDRVYLGRIVDNLVGNAIKYTPQGHVAVKVQSVAQRVQILVSDTGTGISEALLPHLFWPFAPEREVLPESPGAVGLGLTITKRLVELMGGTIAVETELDKGSTFTVSFPRLVGGHA